MDTGWIKIHRKLLNNPLISKPSWAWLWVVLLLKANHQKSEIIWNNQNITIEAGQFITGRKQLSEDSGIAQTTVEDILNYLETRHQIRQQKTTKYRLITILNWNKYQNPTSNPTTERQQSDTNKNDNNEKNKYKSINTMKTINYDTGEIIETNTKHKKLSKEQNNLLIAVGILWCNLVKKHTGLEDSEIPHNKLILHLKPVYLKNNWGYDDFKELFEHWFKTCKEEDKVNFFFCLHENNIAKYKLLKNKKDSPKNFVQLSSEIKL